MQIIIDGIDVLCTLLEQDSFDEDRFGKYINSYQAKVFMKHEKDLSQKTNEYVIKEELKKIFKDNSYKDKYEFYKIKKNISRIKKDITYIKRDENQIINEALERVYKYIPNFIKIKPKIILYLGGIDGGFVNFSRNVYINLGKYIGNIEEFKKVLSHEFYHARKVPFRNRISFFVRTYFDSKKVMYYTLSKILEEGIACLIQHGLNMNIDDPVGTLTNKDILFCEKHFSLLNRALLSIINGKPNYTLIYKVNIYVIGYIIARTLYENGAKDAINEWTIYFNYKKPMKRYIKVCQNFNKCSGFSHDIKRYILSS